MSPEQRRLCIEVLGWNQTQFARYIDRDPATVRRWFSGARAPSFEMDLWLWQRAADMASNRPPGCPEKACFRLFDETFAQPAETVS